MAGAGAGARPEPRAEPPGRAGLPAPGPARDALDRAGLALVILAAAVGAALVLIVATVFIQVLR